MFAETRSIALLLLACVGFRMGGLFLFFVVRVDEVDHERVPTVAGGDEGVVLQLLPFQGKHRFICFDLRFELRVGDAQMFGGSDLSAFPLEKRDNGAMRN